MSAKWNNPAIPAMQEKLHADEREAYRLSALISYLYLQESVCEEKIKLYEHKQDAFKILFWGDLLDQCETVRIRTRQQRDALDKHNGEVRNTLIRLMQDDINAQLERLGFKSRFGQKEKSV